MPKITNLPRLRKTGMNEYQKELTKYQKDLREAAKPRQAIQREINPRELKNAILKLRKCP